MFSIPGANALIGFKGVCGNNEKPNWMTQGYAKHEKNSRGDLYGPVVELISTVTYPLCG